MSGFNVTDLVNRFKENDSMLWVENNNIRLFVSDMLKSHELKALISTNKTEILAFLNDNKIYSKEDFIKKEIFRSANNNTPLSFAQERLWFIEQYEQGTNAYLMPSVFELDNNTDIHAVKYALRQLVQRHEVLRTTIEQVEENGNGIQKVHDQLLNIEEVTLSDTDNYESLINADSNRAFDLSTEYPIRVKLYFIHSSISTSQSLPDKIILLINVHHIASDGWSMGIFQRELLAYYEACSSGNSDFQLPALEIQYKDYATWQRKHLSGPVLMNQLNYWRNKLSGFEPLELPTDYTRPNEVNYKGASELFTLGESLSMQVRKLAQRTGATLHSVLLGSVNILLSKYTGQKDIITGSPIANRHHRQTEGLIGFFVNTQANRTLLDNAQSFENLIRQIHAEQTQAQLYQDLPFEKLVDELGVGRDASRHPVFQVMFSVQGTGNHDGPSDLQKKFFKPYLAAGNYDVEKFDLSIFIDDNKPELTGQISYAASLFCKATIERLVKHYIHLLTQLVEAPDVPYQAISLLDPEEYNTIVHDWNATDADYPKDKTIHQLFREQAVLTPESTALVFEGHQLTYRALDEKSNQLARHIREQYLLRTKNEMLAGTLVMLYLERGLEMVIGILAVLKAGGTYVPIDTSYPQERVDYLIENTQAALILGQRSPVEHGHAMLSEHKLVYIDLKEAFYKTGDSSDLPKHSTATDLAYVIYTSGTTGKPKGVMLEHFSLVNRILYMMRYSKITADDYYLFKTNYIFDVSVSDIFTHLCAGATLHITRYLFDLEELDRLLQNDQITSFHLVPSQYELASPILKRSMLRKLYFSGEALSAKILSDIRQGTEVYNYYGPTETGEITVSNPQTPESASIIGTLFPNSRQYVLDKHNAPVPIGVAGELYIGGAGIARGYLNRPELTTERFIQNPFATEADKAKGYTRLYKTGDLVRFMSNGNLEFIGRNDDQVKIHGYRIELGEIESALSQIAGIKQSCVLARERKTEIGNTKYLAAYYVLDTGHTVSPKDIQSMLTNVLPDYMVPATFTQIDIIPLTVNGKLDKRSLPEPDISATQESYVAPANETETTLCTIWQEVLGLEKVSTTDDFFRIGGNSILAIHVAHRMSKALANDIRVADVFRHKSISQLLNMDRKLVQPKIIPQVTDRSILSFAQERLWFIEQYAKGTNAYHIPVVFELAGDTDIDGIKHALQQVVWRHEVLRSTIEKDDEGNSCQRVHENPILIEDLTLTNEDDYATFIKEDINRPFDLSTEYPVRVIFYKILPTGLAARPVEKTILLINLHHIAGDGWSMDIFQREMFAYYEAYVNNDDDFTLPPLEMQYKDYAVWQRSYLAGPALDLQLRYWSNKLSDFQSLVLPIDYTRPGEIDYRGASEVFTINREISSQLRGLAQRCGVTLNSVLLSSISILLGKYTGQEDIITGSPNANRHHQQTEGLIGFFVNTLANRVLLDNTQSFEGLIMQVHKDQVLAQMHQDLPFEKLIEELGVARDASRHPVFQVIFGVQSFGSGKAAHDQRKKYFEPYVAAHVYDVAKFDLSFLIDDSQPELIVEITYATSLFKPATIKRLAGYYTRLLEQLTFTPWKPYSSHNVLSPQEYEQIVYGWNDTDKDYPKNKTIHKLFEEQAARTPDNIALVFGSTQMSYKALDEKSNQLARRIRKQYLKMAGCELPADTLIALYLHRGFEMVVGILAVLKAGGAYVPMDTNYPQERIDYLLQNSKAELILSQGHQDTDNQQLSGKIVINIDLIDELYQAEDASGLPQYNSPEDLAYVIYTSGTTGKPKGVMQMHGNVMRLFTGTAKQFGFKDTDVWTLFHSYVFDFSVWELWGSLLYGGKLIVLSQDQTKDTGLFYDLCRKHKVSVLNQTPSAFYRFADIAGHADEAGLALRYIIFGGEALNTKQLETWWNYQAKNHLHTKLINMYGITETTVHVTYKELTRGEGVQSNIGKAIPDMKAYVLDASHVPVPIGVTGELYVGGAGLARGYLNRHELTRERFLPNPFATDTDRANGYTRLYKTGDLVRWLPDGELEFIGRNDDQVKIRGYRIELGEIEHVLSQIPGIRQSCVLAKERQTKTDKDKYLAAYYVLDKDVALTPEDIQSSLATMLPEYMVPAAMVAMASFPMTINGKLDKNALPEPDFSASQHLYAEPANEAQSTIARIWEEVLGLERVGITDDFFRIGGNSILAIQVSHRMSKALGYDIFVSDLFKCKTIKTLEELSPAKQDHNIKGRVFAI